MKKNIRVALSFATFPDDQLNSFAILVIVCLKTNALFPNLPLTIAALTALQTAYQDALAAAAQGGTMQTAAKNEARDALVSALRQTAAYVQTLAPTLTLSQILSSGYDVVNTNSKQSPLLQPLFTLDNSVTTQLAVLLAAVTNAKAYQVQFATGAGAWQEAGNRRWRLPFRCRGSRRESAVAQLFSLGHIRTMKKLIFTFGITMLATHLPAPTAILTATTLAGGNLQIVASIGPQVRAYGCVLDSTTDLATWTAISTNTFPGDGLVTNIVQTTNSMCFYKVEVR